MSLTKPVCQIGGEERVKRRIDKVVKKDQKRGSMPRRAAREDTLRRYSLEFCVAVRAICLSFSLRSVEDERCESTSCTYETGFALCNYLSDMYGTS